MDDLDREWEVAHYQIDVNFEKHDFFGYFPNYPDLLAEVTIYKIADGICYSVETRLRDFNILKQCRELNQSLEHHIVEDDYNWFMGRHAYDEAKDYAQEVMEDYARRFGTGEDTEDCEG
jgi:hypothetical protein